MWRPKRERDDWKLWLNVAVVVAVFVFWIWLAGQYGEVSR
jgi:hypothetical protein